MLPVQIRANWTWLRPVESSIDRCRGLVVNEHQQKNDTIQLEAWCEGYGLCPIWPISLATEKRLHVASWYSFGVVFSQRYKCHVVDARSAQLIPPVWPSDSRQIETNQWTCQVLSVPVVVGALRCFGTIAYSPFFQRIRVDIDIFRQFFLQRSNANNNNNAPLTVRPGAVLLLDIANVAITDGFCHWSAARIVQVLHTAEAAGVLKELGVRQLTATFRAYQQGAESGTVWLSGEERREKICFQKWDFNGAFDPPQMVNGLFKVFVGEQKYVQNDFYRAFYAEWLGDMEGGSRLTSSLPPVMTKQQQAGHYMTVSQLISFTLTASQQNNNPTGSDGGTWCNGLVLVCQTVPNNHPGLMNRFVWCEQYQLCQFLPGDRVHQLTIGRWYRFLIRPHRSSKSGLFVVRADDAQPIASLWPASFLRVNAKQVSVQVHSVLAILGAIAETGDAIAFSPFFQRIHVEAASIFRFEKQRPPDSKLTPPSMLLLDVVKVTVVEGNGYEWKATRIHGQWDVNERELTQLGIRKLACRYVVEDRQDVLHWLMVADDPSEIVCFADGDFVSGICQRSFKQGDRFTAWLGSRQALNGHARAFLVVPLEEERSAEQTFFDAPSSASRVLPTVAQTETGNCGKGRKNPPASTIDPSTRDDKDHWTSLLNIMH